MKQSILGFIFALLLLMGALTVTPVSKSETVAAERTAASETVQPEAEAAAACSFDGCHT